MRFKLCENSNDQICFNSNIKSKSKYKDKLSKSSSSIFKKYPFSWIRSLLLQPYFISNYFHTEILLYKTINESIIQFVRYKKPKKTAKRTVYFNYSLIF